MTDNEKLLKAIGLEFQKAQSVVVSAAEIAVMCGYAPDSTPARRIIADPTFPESRQLVEGGNRKWLRADVEAWVTRKFAQSSLDAMSAAVAR